MMTAYITRSCKALVLLTVAAAALASSLPAQISAATPAPFPTSARALSYEIVTIKPHQPGGPIAWRSLPDGFNASGASLEGLVTQAYGFGTDPMTDQELARQPSWFRSARFDISARVDSSDVPALQESMSPKGWAEYIANLQNHVPTLRMRMLQQLLADRFHLQVHHEIKQLPVYALVIARGGPKLTVSKLTERTDSRMISGNGKITASSTPLVFVLDSLTDELGRPVLDRTGLTASYDFTLKWVEAQKQMASSTDNSAPDANGPSLFTAIQEQLGLKLEPTQAPVDTIVIDHVEIPSEN